MSLRWRLTVYWALVTTAILVAAGWLVLFLFSRALWGTLDRALLEEGDTGANALAQSTAPEAWAILHHLAGEKDLGPGRRVRLLVGNQTWFDEGEQRTHPPPALPIRRADQVEDGAAACFALVPLQFKGQAAWLQNGVDATPVRRTVAHLRRTLWLVLPVLLLGCVAGGYLLAAWALAPIGALAAALGRIGPRDLQPRLTPAKTHDEIARLIDSINQLLARLERATATQRQFISEAAHELRTPLTVLRSGLEIALRRPRSVSQSRAALADALEEVERLCATAEDLLALARLDLAHVLPHAPVDVAPLVIEAARRAQPLAEARHQTLRVIAGEPVTVRGSQGDLARVMLNLLDNAIKFTPERGVIEIALSRETSGARLMVRDSGPGLAPAELERIFDPFFTSPRHKAAGSGLGLALCRQIVALHSGTIEARNRREGGCEIEIRLPALPT